MKKLKNFSNATGGGVVPIKTRFSPMLAIMLSLVIVIAVTTCKKDSEDPKNDITPYTLVVGAEGGAVIDPNGASVVIPAGALTTPTEISITTYSDGNTLNKYLGVSPFLGGAEFGPAGLTFKAPVTITLPADQVLTPGEEYEVFMQGKDKLQTTSSPRFSDYAKKPWGKLEETGIASADGKSVSFTITHFTTLTSSGFPSGNIAVFGNQLKLTGNSAIAFNALKGKFVDFIGTTTIKDDKCYEVVAIFFDAMGIYQGTEFQHIEVKPASYDYKSNIRTTISDMDDFMSTNVQNVYQVILNIYWSETPVVPVTGITLNKNSTTLSVGNTEWLMETIEPSNATNKKVTWASSDASKATVSNMGGVTAVAIGTATITVTTDDGAKTASCVVTIGVPVTGVSLNKTSTSLKVGSTEQLTETITPSNATNKSVTWGSSDASKATVNSTGLVAAVAAGTATITVTTTDGAKTATCTVTIPQTYTVTYNGNGSTSGSAPTDIAKYEQGQSVTVLGNTGSLVKTGNSFMGWNTQADGNGITYTQGQTFVMGTANVTLYAKWKASYALRDRGPAGGWIFYDKGSFSDGWQYLEAAPYDQTPRVWGTNNYTVQGADGTAIGTGEQNTLDIITNDPLVNKAANECFILTIVNNSVTYDDWFLPSKDEINLMYVNLRLYGVYGFADFGYWSSSENDASHAMSLFFETGGHLNGGKSYIGYVRAVRAF